MIKRSFICFMILLFVLQPSFVSFGAATATAETNDPLVETSVQLLAENNENLANNENINKEESFILELNFRWTESKGTVVVGLPGELVVEGVSEQALLLEGGEEIGTYHVEGNQIELVPNEMEETVSEQTGQLRLVANWNEEAVEEVDQLDLVFVHEQGEQVIPLTFEEALVEEEVVEEEAEETVEEEMVEEEAVESDEFVEGEDSSEAVEEERESVATDSGLIEVLAEAVEIPINIITNVVLKDEDGELIHGIDNPDNRPELGDIANIYMDWALPNGHGYGAGSTFTFSLPQLFEVYNDVEGTLDFGSETVGSFVLEMDGTVTVTFNEQIEQLSNITGTLWFETEMREEHQGSVEQEIIFNIKDEDVAKIPVVFETDFNEAIEKRGIVDRSYNATEITWTVDFNKNRELIEQAVLKDPIQANQQLKPDSIKVYKLDVQLDGTVIQGEEVSPDDYSVQEDPFEISFGNINEAYRVEFTTEITDDEQTQYYNEATITGANKEDISAGATVTTGRGEPLEKRSSHYDPINQTITWEIKYNYNEKVISQEDAKLTDYFTNTHDLIIDSIKVERVTINENGQESGWEEVNYYQVTEVSDATRNGFELQFDEAIDSAYKITYQTKANERVYENGVVNNKVESATDTANAGRNVQQQILNKWHSEVNYANKTVRWTIEFNKDSHEMREVKVVDTFPNKGLHFLEETLTITNTKTGVVLSQPADYQLIPAADGNGFEINFTNMITDPHVLTYVTEFDYDDLVAAPFKNGVTLSWNDANGDTQKKEAASEFYPDQYTQNNGFKGGSYNAVTKEITWTIGVNYDLKTLENMTVTDYIQGDQNLIPESIRVYEAIIQSSNHMVKGEELPEDQFHLQMTENSDNEEGFIVEFPYETDKPYLIEFKTSLEGELIVNRYDNKATLESVGRDPIDLDAHVNVNHGGQYVNKSGQQNGRVIDWRININFGQSTVSNAKVKDEQQANQILLEDSFELYSTTVSTNGQPSKADLLVEGEDYELFIETNEDGSQTFELIFLEDPIERPYILEYQSYINDVDGATIQNNATFTGDEEISEGTNDNATVVVRFTSGGGTGTGERGSLEVTKVDHDTGEPLEGARFTLYDSDGQIAIRSLVTGEDGKVVFENLLFDDYLLKEDQAPEGYVVGIQDTQTVTVDGASTVTIENKKILRHVELTKYDGETRETLSGAVFTLERKVGNDWEVVETDLVVEEDGRLLVEDLEAGEYRFIETKAPEHYLLDSTPIYFEIEELQTEITIVEKNNTIIKGHAQLLKIDSADNSPLEGVEFELRDRDTNEIVRENILSNEEGLVELNDLRPGSYQLIETKALEFYQLDPTPINFEIEPGNDATISLGDKENKLVTGGVQLTKVDEDDSSIRLEGAIFTLLTADDEIVREGLATNEAGVLVVENLAPGSYKLVETQAPQDYELDPTPIEFTIEKSDTSTIQAYEEMTNALKTGSVELVKQDDSDQTPLEGAVFDLYSSEDVLSEEGLTTNAEGKIEVENLKPGHYYFVETSAPEHYLNNPDVKYEFEIVRSQLVTEEVIVTNTLIPGAVSLVKVDEDQEEVALEGAEFKLVDAENNTVEEGLVTDENGRIIVQDLAPGTYYFIETKAPEHYQLDATPQEVIVERSQETAASITMTNALVLGAVVLEKVDSVDGTILLEGAVFQLLDEAGAVIEEHLVTDENGRIVVENLKPGNYQFVEIEAPTDYQLLEEAIEFEIVRSQEEALVISVENTLIPGAVELQKVNLHDSSEKLEGAEFELQLLDGTVIESGLTTNEEGKIVVQDLPPGMYQFVETKAPADFVLDATPIPFEIERSQTETLVITATNELIRGGVELLKVDDVDTSLVLRGATFELRTLEGTVVESLVTDEEGKVVFTNVLPGDYQLVEVEAPFGYILDSTPINVTIERSQEAFVLIEKENTLTPGSVQLIKVDNVDNRITLAGAEFNLLDEFGELILEGLVTDEEGFIEIDQLPPGDYQLVETKAPEHYVLDETPVIFTIEKGQTVIPVLTKENTLIPGSVVIKKVDEDNENVRLIGAEFKLEAEDGTIIAENLVTDEDGRIIVQDLAPETYYFIETKAPEHYQLDATPQKVIVERSQEEAAIITMTNKLIPGVVVLEKTDSVDETILLEGAVFQLLDEAGDIIEESLVTDGNGRIVVENLKPGNYQFIEIEAPTDYQLLEEAIEFEIERSQEEALVVTVENTLITGAVQLVKLNGDDQSERLEGAEFVLLDESGNDVETGLVTNEEGVLEVDGLAPGVYQFVEIKAPAHFVLDATPILFEIDRSQAEQLVVTATNELEKGQIEIVKVDKESEKTTLEGATFELRDESGKVVDSGVTNEEGILTFANVSPGDYVIIETEAPTGYELDETPHFVVVERGQVEAIELVIYNQLIPEEPGVPGGDSDKESKPNLGSSKPVTSDTPSGQLPQTGEHYFRMMLFAGMFFLLLGALTVWNARFVKLKE
ncbi:SpaA isopeptide-forming pilin-related protein [Alkalihalobacillus sp. 1P02AB]|uniref:SpaA isopeptide-forming pilin-related protein n=1 Tax=Alkalihalobacillus sp. 1P02AB TaxID=3132260 RepID=UPI0039A6E587